MSYFSSPQEVDCYVGGILRLAAVHPTVGPQLAEPRVVLRIRATDPDAEITLSLAEPVSVAWDDHEQQADIELTCPADDLDSFFRGHNSLLDALATGRATARGRISKVLKLLPALEHLFPTYCELVAAKDGLNGVVAPSGPHAGGTGCPASVGSGDVPGDASHTD